MKKEEKLPFPREKGSFFISDRTDGMPPGANRDGNAGRDAEKRPVPVEQGAFFA